MPGAGAAESGVVRALLIGATGRMGQALLRAAPSVAGLRITGAVASPASPALGRDAGEVAGVGPLSLPVESDPTRSLGLADVALDFSTPLATAEHIRACRERGKPLLLGTTGLGGELDAALEEAALDIPLLVAPNTSIAVAVLTQLVRSAARCLPSRFDVDVLDFHHRGKRDAPSGTALALGAAAASADGRTLSSRRGTAGDRVRSAGQVELVSVRAGDLVGEHTVRFCGPGEELLLTHRATDRAVFARGALEAALWLASQPAGRYTMDDFLGFKTIS